MSITSVYPYFLLMGFFIFLGGRLERLWKTTPALEPTTPVRFSAPLESLRGLLAISVFFYHSEVAYFFFKNGRLMSPPSDFYLSLGSGPVTLFFFLSGYLFWSKCMKEGGIKKVGLYFRSRFRRILPAYYFSSLLVVLGALIITHFSLREPLSDIFIEVFRWLVVGLPFGNFPLINSYPDTLQLIGGVVWSLRLEMLFYFALPLMAILSSRHWSLLWISFFALLYAIMFKVKDAPSGFPPFLFGFFYDLSRYFSLGFAFGMLAAYIKSLAGENVAQVLANRRFLRRALDLLAIFFLFLTAYKNSPAYSPRQSFRLLIPFLVIVFDQDLFGLLRRPSLIFLGKISYSTYLIHGFVLFVACRAVNLWIPFQDLSAPAFWLFVMASGSIVLLLSSAMFHWIEEPFSRNRARSR